MRYALFRDAAVLGPLHTYLSFIHFARNHRGRFRNFMSYDRRWLEDEGGEDCQGRVLWALAYVADHPPDEHTQSLCVSMFDESLPAFTNIRSVRPAAFIVLACHYYLRRFTDDSGVRDLMGRMVDLMVGQFEKNESDDWPWFENTVTYSNARVPQALILAGLQMSDDALIERGKRSLDWLLKVQTGDHGQLSLIGNENWLRPGHPKSDFDQQPVEIAALVGACKAAYRASDDRRYLIEMQRCFDWFIGTNDLGLPMIDFKSRGCFDGLRKDGVNNNQGAESLLSWLLSLLIMHEMQTGDPNAAG